MNTWTGNGFITKLTFKSCQFYPGVKAAHKGRLFSYP